jgi:hypothetical protein
MDFHSTKAFKFSNVVLLTPKRYKKCREKAIGSTKSGVIFSTLQNWLNSCYFTIKLWLFEFSLKIEFNWIRFEMTYHLFPWIVGQCQLFQKYRTIHCPISFISSLMIHLSCCRERHSQLYSIEWLIKTLCNSRL